MAGDVSHFCETFWQVLLFCSDQRSLQLLFRLALVCSVLVPCQAADMALAAACQVSAGDSAVVASPVEIWRMQETHLSLTQTRSGNPTFAKLARLFPRALCGLPGVACLTLGGAASTRPVYVPSVMLRTHFLCHVFVSI